MLLIVFIAIASTLLGGFLLLTAYERSHTRVWDSGRRKLDRIVGRALFIARHVDWSAFTKHMMRTGLERVVHDVAHGTLVVVRFLERTLTRFVRFLRERRAGIVTTRPDGVGRKTLRETVREFRKSLIRKDRHDVS